MVKILFCDRCGKPIERESDIPGFEYFDVDLNHMMEKCLNCV